MEAGTSDWSSQKPRLGPVARTAARGAGRRRLEVGCPSRPHPGPLRPVDRSPLRARTHTPRPLGGGRGGSGVARLPRRGGPESQEETFYPGKTPDRRAITALLRFSRSVPSPWPSEPQGASVSASLRQGLTSTAPLRTVPLRTAPAPDRPRPGRRGPTPASRGGGA